MQLAQLKGEYAHLSTQFKLGYPRLAQLKAQVEEIGRRLRQEIQTVVEGLKSAYLAADAQEKELRAKLGRQKAAALALKDASVQYAILAREVDTNSQLYDNVLQRMKEIGVAVGLRASNVFVIDQAEPPLSPSKPKKRQTLFLSALLGLMLGIGLAFFLEYLDNTLKTPEEVERYFHLPSFGVVPDFLRLNHRDRGYLRKPARYTSAKNQYRVENEGSVSHYQPRLPDRKLVPYHQPFSIVTEAYRTLRTAILLSQAGEPPKTILFTSGTTGEGKTATVVNTALMFAQLGVRVMVIDADLRRPSCHKVLKVENSPGLTNLLTGQSEMEKVIKPTAVDNLFLLSGGSIPPNPTELVGSKKMHETIVSLQEHYDYILIDSPPVMPISDAVLLSTMVDGVVLVVSGQKTPRNVVKEARSRLDHARAKILGVVLNRVNISNGDYRDYCHHYYSYYTEAKETE